MEKYFEENYGGRYQMLRISIKLRRKGDCIVSSEITEYGIERVGYVDCIPNPFSIIEDNLWFDGIDNLSIKKQVVDFEQVNKKIQSATEILESEMNKIQISYSKFNDRYKEILYLIPFIVAVSLLGNENEKRNYLNKLRNQHNEIPKSYLIEQLFKC